MSKKASVMRLLSALAATATLGAVALLPGCTVTDPGGGKWTIGPNQKTGPNNGTKVGQFCTDSGACFDLIDTNGDGVPDFAVDPNTQKWYPITPPNPGYQAPVRPNGQTAGTPNPSGDGSDTQTDRDGGPGNEWWRRGLGDRIQFDSGWGGAPFDFQGLSADTWIQATGLDIDAGEWSETYAMALGHFDTDTNYTEVTIFWTGEFKMPNVLKFDLEYQITGLENAREGGDDVYAFELRGDLREVVKLALSIGDPRINESIFEFDNLGVHWSVVAERAAKRASLYANGEFVTSLSLN